MRFWDTSAIIPLLLDEPQSPAVLAELERDPHLLVWWATEVECISAIARRGRDGSLDEREVEVAAGRLDASRASWQEVQPSARVRATATRLCRTHPLRAADALQLASAIVAADHDPGTLPLVTLDDRLAIAARAEGFRVVEPAQAAEVVGTLR